MQNFSTQQALFSASFMTCLLENMIVTLIISAKYISEFVSLYPNPEKANF